MKMFTKKYSSPILNDGCGKFEINNWIISNFVIRELISIVGIKPYPLNELMLMTAAVCTLKPTHIFEWGTHFGKSARIFYETATQEQLRYFPVHRLMAMKNATDNAMELIDILTLEYNKARQAKITFEIADMVTARLALN